jgi:YVTN family beta-propeller protein
MAAHVGSGRRHSRELRRQQSGWLRSRGVKSVVMPMRTVVITLAVLVQTPSIVAQQPAFVVGEKVAGSVGFYDAQFRRLSGVKVGVHPHEMWLSDDNTTLYVADNGVLWMTETGPGENTISVIDVPSQRRTAVIDLGEFRRPHGIMFDEASGRVWVTTEHPSQLLSVDPVKRRVLRRYDVQGKAPHIVNIGLGWAFTSNTDTGTVAAINTDSGEVRLISSGARPQGQALSSDRKTLYVANSGESSISILDLERNTRIGTIPTGRAPVRLALLRDGRTLIYALQEGRSVGFADIESRKEIRQIPLAGRPVSISLSRDGRLAYSSVQEEDKIYVISTSDKKIVGVHDTPRGTGPDPVIPLR